MPSKAWFKTHLFSSNDASSCTYAKERGPIEKHASWKSSIGIFRFGKKLHYWCFCVKKFPHQLFCRAFPDGCLWWCFHIFMHNTVYSANIQVSWGRLTIVKETKSGDRRVAWLLSNNDWSSIKYQGKLRSDCQVQQKSDWHIADAN